jgi:hypothetical protein
MRATVLFALLCAIVFSAGCAAPSTPPQPAASITPLQQTIPVSPPQPAATVSPTQRAALTLAPRTPAGTPLAGGELSVTFERYGGFTGRHDTFNLRPDGSVDDGKIVLHADGGSTTASQLAAQIAATGIYSVNPGSYMPANTCCDRFEYDFTLTQNGKTYNFVTIDGFETAPPAIIQTVRLISQYIDSAH